MTLSSEAPRRKDSMRRMYSMRRIDIGIDLLVFLAGLVLYTWTLAPGLQPADAGEYQLTGAVLGVAHPPGYALYTIVSWLTTKAVFWLTPAQAITALSAALAAGALALVNRAGRTLSGSLGGGLLAALGLAASTTFWAQATTANVRMPTVFALTLALAGLTALRLTPQRRGALATTGFGLGLMTSHHPSTIFLAAVLGLAALWATWRGEGRGTRLAWLILPAALPFVAWLYFPLNANGVGAPANLATLDGFLQHITARGFGGDMLGFANARELPERWPVLVQLIGFQWPWALVGLMAVGLWSVERGAWSGERTRNAPGRGSARSTLHALRSTLLLGILIHTFIAITYRAPQTTEYLLPTYVLMALALSGLLSDGRWPAAARGLLALVAVVLSVWQIGRLALSYRDLAADTSTDAYTRSVLDLAPEGAAVLAPWHYATPMWYLQRVEGLRPDVEVVYVLNQGEATYGESWLRDIKRFLPERQVILTAYDHAALDGSGLRFQPLETPGQAAWLVEPLLMTGPTGLTGGVSFDPVTYLGARELPGERGDQRVYLLAWRLTGEPRDMSVYVHALDVTGQLVAQDDQRWSGERIGEDGLLIGRFTITAPPQRAPGTLTLTTGVYLPDGTNLGEAPLGDWSDPAPLALPPDPVRPTLDFRTGALPLSFDNQVIVTGVAAPTVASAGERIVVVIDMLAARALNSDLTLSLRADGSGWSRQYDVTPIGGALPTLKWVAGAALQDRIAIDIPADAAAGTARLSLGWYDAFSQRDLPPLDPIFAQQGLRVLVSEIDIR